MGQMRLMGQMRPIGPIGLIGLMGLDRYDDECFCCEKSTILIFFGANLSFFEKVYYLCTKRIRVCMCVQRC